MDNVKNDWEEYFKKTENQMTQDEELKTIKLEIGEIFVKHNLTFAQTEVVWQEVKSDIDTAVIKLVETLKETTLIGNKCMPENDLIKA